MKDWADKYHVWGTPTRSRVSSKIFRSPFIPLYVSLVRPRLQYGMSACWPKLVADINHLERIQRLAIKLVTGMGHLPYEEKLQWIGFHS